MAQKPLQRFQVLPLRGVVVLKQIRFKLLADLFRLPFELVRRIYGTRGTDDMAELSTTSLTAAALLFVAGFVTLLVTRYRRVAVTR